MSILWLAVHRYWNLGGHASGTILDHRLRLRASAYTPVGPTLIPTGEILPVCSDPAHYCIAPPFFASFYLRLCVESAAALQYNAVVIPVQKQE